MLTDPEEIKLVATAGEPGLRAARRSARGPVEIVRDFMRGVSFAGRTILELGPGHYEFCELVRARGGRAAVVELDPSIAELGRRRGHEVFVHDLVQLPTLNVARRFDGLLCKGSNNPFWFYDDRAALERYTRTLLELVTPEGWLWIASCPWTANPIAPAAFNQWLEIERAIYRAHGFFEWRIPNPVLGGFYGISVPCENLGVYTRGLLPHRWSVWSLGRLALFHAKHSAGNAVRTLRRRR